MNFPSHALNLYASVAIKMRIAEHHFVNWKSVLVTQNKNKSFTSSRILQLFYCTNTNGANENEHKLRFQNKKKKEKNKTISDVMHGIIREN